MKKITLLNSLTILMFSIPAFTQAPNLEWVNAVGGALDDVASSITIDASGNSYTMGYFTGTVDFDPGPEITILNTTTVYQSMYITKSNVDGNFVWAQKIEGPSTISGNSVSVDASGSIYILCSFKDTVDFDPGQGVENLIAKGNRGIAILKLDSLGNFIWAKDFGGTINNSPASLTLDGAGNIYITGDYKGMADFDPGIGEEILTSDNATPFILKLNSSGHLIWVKAFEVSANSFGAPGGIYVDSNGSVYSTGHFSGTIDLDPGINTTFFTSSGNQEIYISKLDNNGDFIWAKVIKGTSYEKGISITSDIVGNVYTTGFFSGVADFDPNSDTVNLISNGGADIFVLKLNTNGEFIWAKSMGGNGDDFGFSIATHANGGVYIAGSFRGTVDFDPGPLEHNLTAFGIFDGYIYKMDSMGNFSWVHGFGSPTSSNSSVYCATTDINGDVYFSGSFSGVVDFDPGPETFNLTSHGFSDLFTMKLSQGIITGLDERKHISSKVYPNPFNENAVLVLPEKMSSGILTIYNVYGKLVRELNCENKDQIILNRGHLPAGIYYYNINNDNKGLIYQGNFLVH